MKGMNVSRKREWRIEETNRLVGKRVRIEHVGRAFGQRHQNSTGVEVYLNIIKIDSLMDDVIFDTHNQHQLRGINNQLIRTIGSKLLTLDAGKHNR